MFRPEVLTLSNNPRLEINLYLAFFRSQHTWSCMQILLRDIVQQWQVERSFYHRFSDKPELVELTILVNVMFFLYAISFCCRYMMCWVLSWHLHKIRPLLINSSSLFDQMFLILRFGLFLISALWASNFLKTSLLVLER